MTNSTVSGNTAGRDGGGVFDFDSGGSAIVNVTSSTIVNNTANRNIGGYSFALAGQNSIRNTIVANNTANGGTSQDVNGQINSLGFNLIENTTGATINETQNPGTNITGQDPNLGPLQNNGGGTQTHALFFGSPAIDKGDSSGATTDQRGSMRPVDDTSIPNAAGGDGADIGAYERQLPTADDIIIEGFVRTATGAPIVGAIITLSGSTQERMPTDGGGHYRFTVPSGGIYQVTVTARGFRFTTNQQTFGSLVTNQVADFVALPAKGRTGFRPRVR